MRAELLGRVGTGTWVDHAHFLKGTPFYGGHGRVQIPLGAGLVCR
jgi:hypothetical protein